MKGRKNVLKTKVRSSNNIYSKILACCILVAIFTGYLMPPKVLAGDNGVSLGYCNKELKVQLLAQMKWYQFRKEYQHLDSENNEFENRFEMDEDGIFVVPRRWIAWCGEKGYNKFEINIEDEKRGFSVCDFSKFTAIKEIDINSKIPAGNNNVKLFTFLYSKLYGWYIDRIF